jgi:signal transduction histidine kinase
MRPQDLPKLFRAFSQVHGQALGTFGGTGLGLVLSRALAERMLPLCARAISGT